MIWLYSILAAMASFTVHALTVKALGERLSPAFLTPAFYTFAVIILYALFLWQRPKVDWGEVAAPATLIPIIIAGVTIGLTDFFFVRSLNQGAPISVAIPILLGGSTVLITLISAYLFKESINMWKVLGVLMTVGGIYLVYKK